MLLIFRYIFQQPFIKNKKAIATVSFVLGSKGWKKAWSSYLQGIDTIFKEGLANDDSVFELIDEPD